MAALPYPVNSSDLSNFSNSGIVTSFTATPTKTLLIAETDALIFKDVVNPEEAYTNLSTV